MRIAHWQRAALGAILLLCWTALAAQAQTVRDLAQAVASGDVVLVEVTGNGGSSGTALEGVLVNSSARIIRIDVSLKVPLFFRNKGPGQNMLATNVYGRGGSYFRQGGRSFLRLRPRERLQVVLLAYCADFEKDNPTRDSSFRETAIPKKLGSIAAKISAYQKQHPNLDLTVAAQLALWRAQGISLDKIAQRFPFRAHHLRDMRAILTQ